ncbi:MAG: ATP-binding cassette domain-containing protein [Kangiellaceae bacterium]|nr:ATP-binding cassette domain-containing protein [Kangiellaceae bacterium]
MQLNANSTNVDSKTTSNLITETSSQIEVPSSILKRILFLYRDYKLALLITISAVILFGLIDAGMIYFIKPLIDDGLNNSNQKILKFGSLLVILIFVFRGLSSFISNYTSNWISHHIIARIRQDVFSHLLKLPRSFYDNHSRGELVSKVIYDTEQIAKATSGAFISFIRESVILLVLIGLMFITSWHLSLVFIAIGPIIGLLLYKVSRIFRVKSKRLQASMGQVSKTIEQSIKHHQEILYFGAHRQENDSFRNINRTTRQNNMKLVLLSSLTNPTIQIIASLSMAAVLLIASMEGVIEHISAGSFTAILVAMGSLLKPIKQLSKVNENLQTGLAAAESIFKFLDEPAERTTGTSFPKSNQPVISIKNLSFKYPNRDCAALSNITLDILPGEVVALVGSSGSGKSTLVNLLLNLYPTPNKTISFNGRYLEEWSLASLRENFSVVSQSVNLRQPSLQQNITYGSKTRNIDYEKFESCINDTQLSSLFQKQTIQSDFHVGEEACLLSGGQQQRVAIARALYRDAPLLVLDEATSALDQQSEQQFLNTISRTMKNTTMLIVTHRSAPLKLADKIVVMQEGKLVEIGKHNELMDKKGVFYSLYRKEFDK